MSHRFAALLGSAMAVGSLGLPNAVANPNASEDLPLPKASRPPHFLLQAGGYAALGGPSGYGLDLTAEVLPGFFAGRWGLRGQWRGKRGLQSGTALVGLIFEAGASRPALVLKLLGEAGVTPEKNPILGVGVQWSLWLLGPVGVSTTTAFDVIVDGWDTRPALTFNLNLHLGR